MHIRGGRRGVSAAQVAAVDQRPCQRLAQHKENMRSWALPEHHLQLVRVWTIMA